VDRVTTLIFPGAVSGLEGAFISLEPSPMVRFQHSFQSGQHYFSVRAITTNVSANLNVMLGREVCALELVASPQPAYVVEFLRPPRTRAAVTPPAPAPAVRLPATIETVKNYARLLTENPTAAAAIQYARSNQAWLYPDHWVRVEEVWRFDAEDTVIVKAVFFATVGPITYLPDKSGISIGGMVHFASQFDGTGTLPARTEVPLYLAITGRPGGGRNNLAVTNAFVVSLCRPPAPAAFRQDPVTSASITNFTPDTQSSASDPADAYERAQPVYSAAPWRGFDSGWARSLWWPVGFRARIAPHNPSPINPQPTIPFP
jgi:hypothetical protein